MERHKKNTVVDAAEPGVNRSGPEGADVEGEVIAVTAVIA